MSQNKSAFDRFSHVLVTACLPSGGSHGRIYSAFQRIKSYALFSTSLDIYKELDVAVGSRQT